MCILRDICHSAGRLKTVALKHLMRQRDLGASRWMDQFACGFPIDGPMSRKYTHPDDGKSDNRISTNHLSEADCARFRGRSAKSGHKDARLLWGRTRGAGW